MPSQQLFLILHNIRSAHNVGSIFRTADASGVNHIYLSGYTPRPYNGSMPYTTKPERSIIKIALGAQESVPWSGHDTIEEVLKDLKSQGVQIVALEQDKRSVSYRDFRPDFPLALILGHEPTGIDQDILDQCDEIIELPMHGIKQSLNVSVAAGIALYAIIERR